MTYKRILRGMYMSSLESHISEKALGFGKLLFQVLNPEDPCMVYLATFTIKMNQM